MEYYKVTNELTHHGVKGMKWGVRRDKIRKATASVSAARLEDKRNKKQKKLVKLGNRYTKLENKINKINALRDQKISDLSEETIKRGRIAYKSYKTVRNMAVSTAFGGLLGDTVLAPMLSKVNLIDKNVFSVGDSIKITTKSTTPLFAPHEVGILGNVGGAALGSTVGAVASRTRKRGKTK